MNPLNGATRAPSPGVAALWILCVMQYLRTVATATPLVPTAASFQSPLEPDAAMAIGRGRRNLLLGSWWIHALFRRGLAPQGMALARSGAP